ncbi:MAG: HAD family phosphatase [Lachnospiraceae bacterium]|nr:HAD family phosphatase [Lachnospiraceae bacterium]
MSRHPIRAILFDMDGVLTDTEKYYNKAIVETMHNMGYHFFTKEDALLQRSLNHRDCEIMYKNKLGPTFDYKYFHENYNKLVKEWLTKDGIPVKPGIKELMNYLEENRIKAAVVTATGYKNAIKRLEDARLIDYFDTVISAHNVPNGKPYPDPYLYAMSELSKEFVNNGDSPLEQSDCLAIEDSPNGITSATSAGLKTIMIPDLSEPDKELREKLFAVCNDLSKVIDVLEDTTSFAY